MEWNGIGKWGIVDDIYNIIIVGSLKLNIREADLHKSKVVEWLWAV